MTIQRIQGEVFITDLTNDGEIPELLYWQPRKNIMKHKAKCWMEKNWLK